MRRPAGSSSGSGATACWRRRDRCATPRPCCRNGRRGAACQRRATGKSPAPGRTTRPNSGSRSNCRIASRPKGWAARNARPSRPPPPPCWRGPASCQVREASDRTRAAVRFTPRGRRASPDATGPTVSATRKTGPRHPPDATPADQPSEPAQRCGFIALIGAPNVGKSTLVNALVGAKVSIVTHKVQTTRALVRGIATAGSAQLVFIDTPGIFVPRRRLERAMVATGWGGAHDADLVGVLIDARRGLDDEAVAILGRLADVPQPKILIINKIDLIDRPKLLALAQNANDRARFAATFMISALTGDGVEDLRRWLAD